MAVTTESTLPPTLPPGTPPVTPDPLAGPPLHQATTAARAVWSGFGFTFRHRDLTALAGVAVLLYLVVWGVFLWQAATWDGVVTAALFGETAPEAWWAAALWHAGRVAALVLLWLLAFVLAATVALPILSPLFSFLAERVERRWYGVAAPSLSWGAFAVETLRGIGRSFAVLAIEIAGGVTLWLMGFVLTLAFPPAGAAFAVVVGGGWTALALAATLSSFVLENNRASLSSQLALLQRHPAAWLGLGAGAKVLAWLPLAVPFLVVGATVYVCRLHDHGHCRLPARDDSALGPASPPPSPLARVPDPTRVVGPARRE